MSKRVVASIEARMTSSRLPGKVLMEVQGKTMLEIMIERVKKSKLLDDLFIATTVNEEDNPICELCDRLNIKYYRGSESDVLARVLEGHQRYGSDIIVELTGDCPLIDPLIIDKIINKYLDSDFDYVSNSHVRSYPDGLDVQVFSRQVLERVAEETNDPEDREHVSLYIYKSGKFSLHPVIAQDELYWPELRITLDDVGDFELIKRIINHFYPTKSINFYSKEILEFLKSNLDLLELNRNARTTFIEEQTVADNNKIYTVGIIGLGQIGMMYDYDNISETEFFSHAKGFDYHNRFQLKLLIDPDEEKQKFAKKKFTDCLILSSLDQTDIIPDILILSASPDVNAEVLEKFAFHKDIKLFIVEKPLDDSIFGFIEKHSLNEKIIVNYSRKFLPEYMKLKYDILDGVFGKPIAAHSWYSKGIRNNGSHIIDLLQFFFPNHGNKFIHQLNKKNDYKDSDLSYDFNFKMISKEHEFPVLMQVADERKYSLIELDIIFEDGRLRFKNFGMEYEQYEVVTDPNFNDYKNLETKNIVSTGYEKYILSLCDYVVFYLEGKVKNISDAKNDKRIYQLIKDLKENTGE